MIRKANFDFFAPNGYTNVKTKGDLKKVAFF